MPRRRVFSDEDLKNAESMSDVDFDPTSYQETEFYKDALTFDQKYPFNKTGLHNFLVPIDKEHRLTSWSSQNRLKEQIPSEIEIASFLRDAAEKDLKKGAALTLVYLGACRISEILPYKKIGYAGFANFQLDSVDTDYGEILQISTPVLKKGVNRQFQEKGKAYILAHRTMQIPLRFGKDQQLWALRDILYRYKLSLQGDSWFDRLGRKTLAKWLLKNYSCNLHLLRHWRVTAMAEYLNEGELRAIMAWDPSSTMPSRYVLTNQARLLDKALKARQE